MTRKPFALALTIILTITGIATAQQSDEVERPLRPGWVEVSGTGVHYFTTAIVHSSEPTDSGMIQRSTETVELSGDLSGRVLYHPISVLDVQRNTLVNTGSQVFSGTVLGSEPVLLHDDEFRFEVNLATGETVGEVHLVDRITGPRIRCHLQISGIGESTPEGDAIVDYTGQCRLQRFARCAPQN
jgi:hypothetical protein